MNALKELCAQAGLREEALADLVQCRPSTIRAALADTPAAPLQTFLRIIDALGIKLRVKLDTQLLLWFDLAAIDELHTSRYFRQSAGLAPLPQSRRELRKRIRALRRKGRSYGQIAIYLESNCIPTVMGMRKWRKATIVHHLHPIIRKGCGDHPLGRSDQFRRHFRWFVVRRLMLDCCPFDPWASVRYGIDAVENGERVTLRSEKPLPSAIVGWIAMSVRQLGWFTAGEWGTGEETSGDAEAPTPEEVPSGQAPAP